MAPSAAHWRSSTFRDFALLLPELGALVHAESVLIAGRILGGCLKVGENVVVCGTLSWRQHALDLLTLIEDSGYESLEILDIEASKKVVEKRALERWWKGRQAFQNGTDPMGERYIPLALIDQMFPSGSRRWSASEENSRFVYQTATDHGMFTAGKLKYTLIEASGQTPIKSVALANAPMAPSGYSAVGTPASHCRRCHRKLTEPHSRAIGLGPSCVRS